MIIIKIKKNFRYKNNIILIVITFLLMLPFNSIGQEINQINSLNLTYSFSVPTINKITIDSIIYDRILMDNLTNDGNPGEPSLPVLNIKLLLPMGTNVKSIQTTTNNPKTLGYGYNIEPTPQQIKLSSPLEISNSIKLNNSLNSTDKCIISDIETYYFRGYLILIFNIHPVKYDMLSGEIAYYDNIDVKVNLIKDFNNLLFRNKPIDEFQVVKKVDNPFIVSTYKNEKNILMLSEEYDLLIITTENFKEHFIPLKNAHDSDGILTEIVTIEEISKFPNNITPEKIRDFIKKEYDTRGIEYVLIGGDHDIIPSKLLWVESWSGGEVDIMPVDMYYACLDGTFNYDNDAFWGEPNDGENGGDVDLLAEVYVGRASVETIEEVDNFVNKTILQLNNDYNSGSALFVGEFLWSNPDTWGGNYMDELIDNCSKHLYKTVGIPSEKYFIDKLYDMDDPNKNWPNDQIINKINSGAKIINHLGHSNYGYNISLFTIFIL